MNIKYFKNIKDGYITFISTNQGNLEIGIDEYEHIREIIYNCPNAPDGYCYLLRENLIWELNESPVYSDSDEPPIIEPEEI